MTTILRNIAKPYLFLIKDGAFSIVLGLVVSTLLYFVYFDMATSGFLEMVTFYVLNFQSPELLLLKLVLFLICFGIFYLLLTKSFLKFLNNDFFNYIGLLFLTYFLYTVAPLVCYIFVGIGLLLLIFKYLYKGGEFLYDISGSPFGDSRWSSSKELFEKGLNEQDFLLGRDAKTNRVIGFKGEGHVLTVAKTGAGKGVGIVIPNLLNYSGSIIAIDPKGENFIRTIHARRTKFPEQEISLIDPFGSVHKQIQQKLLVLGKLENKNEKILDLEQFYSSLLDKVNPLKTEDSYVKGINPLQLIETLVQQQKYDEVFDQANTIANMIVVKTANDGDPHWNDKAKLVIKNTILFMAYQEEDERVMTLPSVKKNIVLLFSEEINEEGNTIKFMQVVMDNYRARDEFEDDEALQVQVRVLEELLLMNTEEMGSVVSVVMRHMEFVDSPYVERSLSNTEFELNTIKTKEHAVYLVMPANKLESYSRLMRLWIASLVDAVAIDISIPKKRILFMLDEMAQLGYMEPLVQAVSLLRGYGLNMWMIFQDISQMEAIYGNKWKTFSSNAKVQQFFGVSDDDTANYVSKLSGMTTVYSRGETFNNDGGLFGENSSHTYTATQRQLLYPDQLFRTQLQFIFTDEMYPIKAKKLKFFNDGLFSHDTGDFPVDIAYLDKDYF